MLSLAIVLWPLVWRRCVASEKACCVSNRQVHLAYRFCQELLKQRKKIRGLDKSVAKKPHYQKAEISVIARPKINACTSWVPS